MRSTADVDHAAAPTMPHSEDAEQAVLSAAFIDAGATNKLVELLNAEDFYFPRHQHIYRAMAELHSAGSVVDPLTISETLTGHGWLELAGGKDYIGFLVDAVPTAANAEYHAAIVARRAQARRLLSKLMVEVHKLEHTHEAPADIAGRIAQLTLDVQTPGQIGFVSAREIMAALAPALLERANMDGLVGIPTGFTEFDDATGGIREGEVMFVGGVPGSGKTALGLQVALHNSVELDTPNPVGFVSAEMTKEGLMERGVANVGRIDNRRLRKMKLLPDEYSRIGNAFAVLQGAPLHVDDTPTPALSATAARCRALKAKFPELKLIVVDFVQLLMGSGDDDTRAEELRAVSYALKGLAKELRVAFIVLAQLNDKTVDARSDKHPQLQDLQGSSGMRQAADFILLCYRPKQYDESEPVDTVQVNVAKARDLPTFTMELLAQLQFMRLVDRPKPAGSGLTVSRSW